MSFEQIAVAGEDTVDRERADPAAVSSSTRRR
jgi:hypothetical protein